MVACPERLAEKLQVYAYKKKLDPDDGFFPINRQCLSPYSKVLGCY